MCVLGGTLHISLMSFFCSVASGLIYILLLFAVPHTVMLPIRWGRRVYNRGLSVYVWVEVCWRTLANVQTFEVCR